MFVQKETHQNLRGGSGTVITYTIAIRIPFVRRPVGKIIILSLDPFATIGKHEHVSDSEIYLTLSKYIRFNNERKWAFVNRCKRGHSHSASNVCINARARILAFKY